MKKLILTCEHGGNDIPLEYKYLFRGSKRLLNSHRGYDIGSLKIFSALKEFSDFNSYSEISRLLVEFNRSISSKNLFSEFSKKLDEIDKKEIIDKYYFPYRNRVENFISKYRSKKYKVVHISVHTFTPQMNNIVRNCDIGLLYDPQSTEEKYICKRLKREIQALDSSLIVRFNYPYLGIADGFTSYLRKIFSLESYLGIEIEVNQKFFSQGNKKGSEIIAVLRNAITSIKR